MANILDAKYNELALAAGSTVYKDRLDMEAKALRTAGYVGSLGDMRKSSTEFIPVIITPPGAPTAVSATAGNAQATVTFTAPASSGSAAITSYTVTSSPGGFTSTGASSPRTVTGLTNGVAYTFTVTAFNGATGPASTDSGSVTPVAATVPGAPTIGTATRLNDTTISLTFTAPASNGGAAITQYRATASPGGAVFDTAASPFSITGLTPGNSYTFTVKALNSVGYGADSAASNSIVAPGYSADILGNASFGDTSVWTISGSSTISGGNLNANAINDSTAFVSQAPGLGNGLNYRADITLSTINTLGSGLAVKVGGTLSSAITTTGGYNFFLTAGAGANFVIQGAGVEAFTGVIAEAHLYRIY